jgi:cobyrinic acid a,c-diamide synthase
MAIVIGGERSGSGKTTITLALLAALKAKNQTVQSFKVGPDYIDPMFHAYVTRRSCYNLDMILTSENYLPNCFQNHTKDVDFAVIEGVMGLFDGAAEPGGYGSTAQVAKQLQLPVLLVVNCSSMSQSIAALVHGYRSLDPELKFAGIVLNRVGSDRHLEILQAALEPLQIPILGVFRREDEIALPDRHLGLVPTAELPELDRIIDKLAALGLTGFNWDLLEPYLSAQASPLAPSIGKVVQSPPELGNLGDSSAGTLRLAVAHDRAFSFYYAENLERLASLGAELVYWSPLEDQTIPQNIHGFYFGGGFPEMFADQLSANQPVLTAVRQAINAGMPTYAECGGLMYLSAAIVNFAQQTYPMVGILPTQTHMGKRLTLGYRTALAQAATPVLTPGTLVRGHEFHRSHITTTPPHPLFKMQRCVNTTKNGITQDPNALWEGWYQSNLQASYLHLHWGTTPELPQRWLQQMQTWQTQNQPITTAPNSSNYQIAS